MEFLRSVLAQDESVTASTRVTYDLPVNPLSHVIYTLLFLNDTGTITNYTALTAALASLQNIAVEFKGTSVLNGSGKDLAILGQILTKRSINQVNQARTDNDARAISLILPFGRMLYNADECFPASRKGDLKLIIDYAAAQTGIDTLKAQIETVELMGAAPKSFIKATTMSKTPGATGQLDVDLPIGNPISQILLFGTTVPNTAYTATIEKIKCLVDNVEYGYSETNWESLHGELLHRLRFNAANGEHVHYYNGAEAGAATTLQPESDVALHANYGLLDFDPAHDNKYLLETSGHARVHLRITAGDTNALRVLPVEVIGVGG